MFGMSMFRDMQTDPFFEMESHMRQMDQMMRDPFGGMLGGPRGHPAALEAPRAMQHPRAAPPRGGDMMAHPGHTDMFSMFDGMMGNMRTMMSSMHQQMGQVQNSPNGHFISHSSVMTYDNSGGGAPKVYQATSSTHQAPGGVKETRRTMRDSERGIDRMAVGHHINERGHVVQRSRDRTGNIEENQDYINLDEAEAETFNREWREKMGPYSRRGGEARQVGGRRAHHRELQEGRNSSDPSRYTPSALEGAKPKRDNLEVRGQRSKGKSQARKRTD